MMIAEAERINKLVQEVCEGLYEIEKLPNAAYDFRGERQAAYFSHAREDLQTDVAHVIMYDNSQIYDQQYIEGIV